MLLVGDSITKDSTLQSLLANSAENMRLPLIKKKQINRKCYGIYTSRERKEIIQKEKKLQLAFFISLICRTVCQQLKLNCQTIVTLLSTHSALLNRLLAINMCIGLK